MWWRRRLCYKPKGAPSVALPHILLNIKSRIIMTRT
jgi:hypothetical protein